MFTRNLVLAYIAVIVIFMVLWWSVLPTQKELLASQEDAKFLNTVRSLEGQISARYGVPNQTGNLTTQIYTYHNVTVTDWELRDNRTRVVLNFTVSNLYRVRRFGLVVDEYFGPSSNKTIAAYLEGDVWYLNVSSLRTVD